MHSCVHSLLPTTILNTSVPTNIISWSLRIRHALRAFLTTFHRLTSRTVRVPVREWVSPSRLNEGVRRKNQLNFPISIVPRHHLNLKVPVSLNILLFHKHRSRISHVSGGRTWELIIVAVKLDGIPFWRDGPSTERKLFRVIWLPNFDLINLRVGKACLFH